MFFLLTLALTTNADSGIVLRLNDGTEIGFAFSEKPVIIAGSQFVMRTTSTNVSYPFEKVQRIYCNDNLKPSGINTIKKEDSDKAVLFKITDSEIEIIGLEKGKLITVYTVNGMMVATARSGTNGHATINLSGKKGIFIVKTSTGLGCKFKI